MTERAINLRDWEVRALLAGAAPKRWGADVIVRPIVPQPPAIVGRFNYDASFDRYMPRMKNNFPTVVDAIYSPYAVGDVLWGRECWAAIWPEGHENGWVGERRIRDDECVIEYRADSGAKYPGNWPDDSDPEEAPRWRSSMHMPRWACRIERAVATVRPVRVQDLDDETLIERIGYDGTLYLCPRCAPPSHYEPDVRRWFAEQWDADWPEYPYAGNPWGWVLEVTP